MSGMSVHLDTRILDGLSARAEQAGVAGLNLAGERLRALSVAVTPIDEGDLRSGTAVISASSTREGVKVHNDSVYAARQHEELGWRHPRGGQAKYLEQPAKANASELFQIVGASIRRSLS